MDTPAADKRHAPCPVWAGHVGWSTEAPPTTLSTDPRPVYDQLNCLNSSSLFKHNNSTSIFAPAVPSTSHVMSFAQLSQTSSIQTSNHSKNHSYVQLSTQNLAPSPPDTYKSPFQPLLPTQTSSHVHQNVPITMSSCSQHLNQAALSKSTFEGGNVDASMSGYSTNVQEQAQWMPSQLCREEKNKSADVQSGETSSTAASMDCSEARLALIQQREELLKKLSDLDELLKTMPPADSQNEQAAPNLDLSPEINDALSPASHEEPDDFPQDAGAPVVDSDDDSNPDFFPSTDDEDFSDFISHSNDCSSDESSPKKSSNSPTVNEKQNTTSNCPTAKDKPTRHLKRRHSTSQNKSSILVLQCVSKKGKRIYDKKNYCLFCSKPFSKLSRHLEMIHGDQAEVAVAFQYPKHSKERLKIWNRLKNKGNFAHNRDVMKTGKGFLAAVKRPKIPVQDYEFVHCLYCQGLYISKGLFRHMKKCPEKIKNEDEPKVGKRRYAFRCVLETLGPDISEGLKELLSPMINDPVTQAILNHKIILQFGENMYRQQGADPTRHEHIRQNLRQIARLVLEAQKLTPLKELDDFFVPSNFRHVVSAVNVLAGYNSKKNSYARPSLAIKLGYQLQKICGIVETNAINAGDESKAKSAQSFLDVYKKKWNKLVSSTALTSLRETKRVKEKSIPSVQDVKILNSYMIQVHTLTETRFKEHISTETYAALLKAILSRIILFNRRKPGEVSGLKLADFLSRKTFTSHSYAGISLSDLERTMCRFFARMEIRGSCGRIVPVLLKQSFVSTLELLVKSRETCGIPPENPFLFARPSALSAYSGSTTLQGYVKECGAENPETLTTAKVRIHFAAMLQMLNLDEKEANQILGPNYQVLQRSDAIDQGSFQDTGTQTSAQWGHNQHSTTASNYSQSAAHYNQETRHQPPAQHTTTPHRTSRPKKASQKSGKQKWDEVEVRAVERHMMRFIQGHRVPQKMDCMRCLDSEPDALRTRSWKGIKDYVRNRITALKREEERGTTKTVSETNTWVVQGGGGAFYQQL